MKILTSKKNRADEFLNMGGKARYLALMKERGFPIPDFICFSAEEEIDEAQLIGTLAETCGGARRFAVRSSASVEDGRERSYAGQFRSFLNVEAGELVQRIKECGESAGRRTVQAYEGAAIRREHRVRQESQVRREPVQAGDLGSCPARMHIIVQEMVEADFSGVLFTANPLGILSETVITAATGDGRNAVSDRGPVTTYYHNRPDGMEYRVRQEGGPLLRREWLEQLISMGRALEEHFGRGLDAEYTVAGERLFLLQVRPITALPEGRPVLLDNSNISESYPGLSLPLTASFVGEIYTDIFKNIMVRLSGGDGLCRRNPEIFDEMVDCCNGRMFYRLDHWYDILCFLPFSGRIIPIWQEMMGVEEADRPAARVGTGVASKCRIAWNTACLLLSTPRKMERLEKEFLRMADHFQECLQPGLSLSELRQLYEYMNRRVLKQWDITLANDMYSFLYTALFQYALRRKGVSEEIIKERIAGISDLASMRPVRELVRLALLYRQEGKSEEFSKAFSQYIDRYGDRSTGELKMETDTFRERPELLMSQVELFAETPGLEALLEEISRPEKERRAGEGFLCRMSGKRAAVGLGYREASRMNRSRLFGFARRLFLEMGRRLEEAGRLEQARDVFWLRKEELFSVEEEGDKNLKELVERRKKEYEFYQVLPSYRRLVFAGSVRSRPMERLEDLRDGERSEETAGPAGKTPINEEGPGMEWYGTPCSFGKVRGEVLVIEDASREYDTRDKILVTTATDPGWVFLLARAKGLISERGSLLSHTAIVSRELGIPAIVGISGATEFLKNGDLVELDSSSGAVRLLKR